MRVCGPVPPLAMVVARLRRVQEETETSKPTERAAVETATGPPLEQHRLVDAIIRPFNERAHLQRVGVPDRSFNRRRTSSLVSGGNRVTSLLFIFHEI